MCSLTGNNPGLLVFFRVITTRYPFNRLTKREIFRFILGRARGGIFDFLGGTVGGPPPILTEVVPPSSSLTIKCLICLSDMPLAIWAEAVPFFGFTLPFLMAWALRAAVCCLSDLAGILRTGGF